MRHAIALLLVLVIGASRGTGADEVPQALREAVGGHPDLAALLADYTFRRTVATSGEVLDPHLHEFLLNRPDIGAALARLQGLGAYRVRRTGPAIFEGTDGEGAAAVLRIIEAAPGRRVFHARGGYVRRFFPDVTGEAVVLLTTRYDEVGGGHLAHGRLTVYARLDNHLIGWLLRLLLPFIGKVLDEKIAKAFVSESRAVEQLAENPDAILDRLEESGTLPRADVAAFGDLLRRALARRARAWTAAGSSEGLVEQRTAERPGASRLEGRRGRENCPVAEALSHDLEPDGATVGGEACGN